MTTRYYEETPCEHGKVQDHWMPDPDRGLIMSIHCPGGQRRELTGVEVVEVIMREVGEGFAVWSPIVRKPGRYAIIPLESADG